MKQRARQVLVLLLLYILFAPGAANVNDLWVKCVRNTPRSFTQSQQAQLCASRRLGSLNHQDPMTPGQCAKLALGGRPLQSAKFGSRVEVLRAASIIQLCSGTQNTGPAKCWLTVPAQMRQQMLVALASTMSRIEMEMDSEAAAMPLVQTCRRAQDDRPAKCLLLWFEMSKTLRKQVAHDMLQVAVAVCKEFGGEVSALKQCVKQTTPHLRIGIGSEISVLQLCRSIGDGANLLAVVECASTLGRRRVAPDTIAQLCAGTSGVVQPHACFLEAQQKLRWMDHDAQILLCKDAAAHAARAPIDCALEMKSPAQTLRSSGPSFSSTPEFRLLVANLCHGATNTTTVVECVRRLPVRAFTAHQALRLCAASTMPTEYPENRGSVSLYPTSCASQARLLLQRAVLVDGSNDLDMSASAAAAAVHVCEQATSDAPSKCLVATQHDQALSAKFRVQLCQQSTSDSPQQCVHLLRKFVNARRMDIYDTVMVCRQAESLGPAECVAELFKTTASVPGTIAAQLCHVAKNMEPARCFIASPSFYDDELKVSLCIEAENSAPASCVESVITRFGNQPSMKVALCRGASTTAPAACAIEAPFGMDEANVIVLCRSAVDIAPARCAQEVPTSLGVSWHRMAQVCAGAKSTTPGRCLAHHIRHSRLHIRAIDDNQIVSECRIAVAQPAALGIAQASYNCPELRPMCPLQLVLNVLDQYGNPMVEGYHQIRGTNVIYASTAFPGNRRQPALQGPSYATITNGSATFSNLFFTGAGEFTLTFRAGEGITEEVARVLVYPDHAADALRSRCDELFTRFQCSAQSPPYLKLDYQGHDVQALLLPRQFQLSAISCGQYWVGNIGGLVFSGFSTPTYLLYTLPRPLYDLFTNMDVPRADMSAWAMLGLNEGETNRVAIRRAYHRRSLEWHPDKWHALAAVLTPAWQQELGGVYALVSQAYDQLARASARTSSAS